MAKFTLKQHRMRSFLTVHQLAEKADVSPDTIWRIQNGEKPKPATMWKIAQALSAHPAEIKEFADAYGLDGSLRHAYAGIERGTDDGTQESTAGTAGTAGSTGNVRNEPPLETQEFFRNHDLAMLAAQQRVTRAGSFEELLGDFWPADESTEEFLDTLREWRQADTRSAVGR